MRAPADCVKVLLCDLRDVRRRAEHEVAARSTRRLNFRVSLAPAIMVGAVAGETLPDEICLGLTPIVDQSPKNRRAHSVVITMEVWETTAGDVIDELIARVKDSLTKEK